MIATQRYCMYLIDKHGLDLDPNILCDYKQLSLMLSSFQDADIQTLLQSPLVYCCKERCTLLEDQFAVYKVVEYAWYGIIITVYLHTPNFGDLVPIHIDALGPMSTQLGWQLYVMFECCIIGGLQPVILNKASTDFGQPQLTAYTCVIIPINKFNKNCGLITK